MIDTETRKAINGIGERLLKTVPDFYGKITFNYYNGKYVSFNVEQTVKRDDLNEGDGK